MSLDQARSVTAVPGRTAVPTVVPPLGVVVSEALQKGELARTKSLRVAVVDVEDRVSAVKLEKHSPPRLTRVAQVDAALVELAVR